MALQINDQARKDANLRLLQRSMDPGITDILGSATHVVLYHFQQDSQSWDKSNVEGSLFLAVKQTPQTAASYLLVILNRNSPDNFPIPLSKDFQLQNSDPYLIFRQKQRQPDNTTTTTVIRGIWFPNPAERETMHELLTNVLTMLKSAPAVAAAQPVVVTPSAPAPVMDHGAATAALLQTLNIGGNHNGHTNNSSSSSNNAASAIPEHHQPSPGTPTTPMMRQASPSSIGSNNSNSTSKTTLDKKSLQLALLSLIQDDRFLDLLHSQYLRVSKARASRDNNSSNH